MNSHDTTTISAARESFVAAWMKLGAREVPDFAEVVTQYAESHRAYHTLDHVFECLRWLEACRELAERPFEVELALVYHDVVYEPRRRDNEKRSAEMFRAHAPAGQLPQSCAERIAALIEGTASHRANQGDAALVNDIDLAVLGSSPAAYALYERQIRQEYRHVPESLFRFGRRRVLVSFLQREAVYATPYFRQRFEAQARANLASALAATRCGGS